MENKYTLICNLKTILEEKKVTAYRLSKDTGARIGTIYKMVDGKIEDARFPATLLANVCGYLNITMSELFTVNQVDKNGEEK
ncbi:helix-turn-helix domain-containing protein [Paenibacillus illinoisensis]|uniref:helix-turn-helix domain-containing protein n=1 Tax=Paenibacillus illinoisensis TaxID=59845 RepID=UPI00203E860B|nr:helix-turn-helix transcriptional regulator [Paenibacillus illinoisensis]